MDQNLATEAETLTKTLCGHLAAAQFGDLSAAAKHEARRGVLDWIGCALAGSKHKTIDMLFAVLQEAGGRPQASVLGRGLKLGRLDAPLANGQMGHVLDFDDTHMGAPTLPSPASGGGKGGGIARRRRSNPPSAGNRSVSCGESGIHTVRYGFRAAFAALRPGMM